MKWSKLLNESRRRPTTGTGDSRSQFERDFDRAVFSTPVRRLQDKAQVFPLEPHDGIRTRLTHSMEVSSVARGLAGPIAIWLNEKKEINAKQVRDIEAIAATCGLIHDLGNPPFGHSGEDAIREWFEKQFKDEGLEKLRKNLEDNDQFFYDFFKFEGNAQSLRLISRLQLMADEFGLNLTYGTLSASLKYIARSHSVNDRDHSRSKPGYFASENDVVQNIWEETDSMEMRNPITFLVEAADDLVFSACDIEDSVIKGILTWDRLKSELEGEKDPVIQDALLRTNKILGNPPTKVLENPSDEVVACAFRTASIGVASICVIEAFKEYYDSIMGGTFRDELFKVSKAKPLIKKLKTIGATKVYCTKPNLKLELMGRKIIFDLMDIFFEGAEQLSIEGNPDTKYFHGKIGTLLSNNYRQVFKETIAEKRLPEQYCRLQLVTDYICGMTDTFAKSLHADLTNA